MAAAFRDAWRLVAWRTEDPDRFRLFPKPCQAARLAFITRWMAWVMRATTA